MRVAITYHFFAHYRSAVLRRLLSDPKHRYELVADPIDPRNRANHVGAEVPGWMPDEPERFTATRCSYFLRNKAMWQSGLVSLAARRDLDAIIFLGDPRFVATWMAAPLARALGKRVIFWTIGYFHHESRLSLQAKRVYYRMPHALLLYGDFARAVAIREGFDPRTVHVVHNSLDYEQQSSMRERVTPEIVARVRRELFDSDRPIAICVSRLVPKRRLADLIRAADILKRSGNEVNVLLVGDGPERGQLEVLARSLEVNVKFYGPCYEEQRLAELVGSCNVTVAPGMVGLTAMQSLAYGTPVVTHGDPWSQAPEFEAVQPGVNGGLYPPGDLGALAEQIRLWAAHAPHDEQLRRRCYQEIAERWNAEYQATVINAAIEGTPAAKAVHPRFAEYACRKSQRAPVEQPVAEGAI